MKDWDDLRYFHAVAQGGSLSAASRALGVNHSTVFRRINQLEERFRTRLFERLDNRYQLTDAGEQLLARSARVADAMDEIERQIVGQDTLLEGSIRLTCPDTFLEWQVPALVAKFCKQYPRITVELRADPEHVDLSRREADIAIRATNNPPEYLIGRRLGLFPWRFYSRRPLKPAVDTLPDREYRDIALIAPEGALLRVPACQWLEKQSAKFRVVARATSLRAAAALARTGLGIALLPQEAAQGLQPVANCMKNFDTGVWLLTHPDMRSNERLMRFQRFLAGELESWFAAQQSEKP